MSDLLGPWPAEFLGLLFFLTITLEGVLDDAKISAFPMELCGRKNNGKKMQSGSRGCALLHRKVHNPEDLKRSQAGDLRSNKFPLDIQSTGFYFLTTQST